MEVEMQFLANIVQTIDHLSFRLTIRLKRMNSMLCPLVYKVLKMLGDDRAFWMRNASFQVSLCSSVAGLAFDNKISAWVTS